MKAWIMGAAFAVYAAVSLAQPQTWTPDNGNGTFTNPIFYDEFSDPDMIRVGDSFYLTGTTMHSMPGLAVLRSKDLVNWEFVSYAMRCPLTDVAARYTSDRRDNFDIYLPLWLARYNKHVFGTLYVAGIVYTLMAI